MESLSLLHGRAVRSPPMACCPRGLGPHRPQPAPYSSSRAQRDGPAEAQRRIRCMHNPGFLCSECSKRMQVRGVLPQTCMHFVAHFLDLNEVRVRTDKYTLSNTPHPISPGRHGHSSPWDLKDQLSSKVPIRAAICPQLHCSAQFGGIHSNSSTQPVQALAWHSASVCCTTHSHP